MKTEVSMVLHQRWIALIFIPSCFDSSENDKRCVTPLSTAYPGRLESTVMHCGKHGKQAESTYQLVLRIVVIHKLCERVLQQHIEIQVFCIALLPILQWE